MPRAGIGAISIPPLLALEKVGLFPGATQYVADAVQQLARRRDQLIVDGSPAHHLAEQIGRTMPLAYGSDLGEVAAYRFKCQVNENAKAPAFSAGVPEMCHNEICGWGQHGDITRQLFTIVCLRHDHEHPQVEQRFELIRQWTEEVVAGIEEVRAEGDGPLAQALDLVLFGDVVSLHLAYDAGVDPGPEPVLDSIKAALE
jgi:glucose/mannose-6-phosphate isomerase